MSEMNLFDFHPNVGINEIQFSSHRDVVRSLISKDFAAIEEGEGQFHNFVDIYETPWMRFYYDDNYLLEAVEIREMMPVRWNDIDLRRDTLRKTIAQLTLDDADYRYSVVDFLSLKYCVLIGREDGIFLNADSVPDVVVVFRSGYYDSVVSSGKQFCRGAPIVLPEPG